MLGQQAEQLVRTPEAWDPVLRPVSPMREWLAVHKLCPGYLGLSKHRWTWK